MSRHNQLFQLIDLFQPKTIVEIGTWNGWNAIKMIQAAQKYHPVIGYVGYDLFEEATAETDALEFNVKKHCTVDGTLAKIRRHCPKVDINLIKGNTRDTLKFVTADLAFVDGGHSVQTIAHDVTAVQSSKIIVLDDYYTPDNNGACPNISMVGCNALVSDLDRYLDVDRNHIVLPVKDPLKDGGHNQMVLII